MSWSAAYCLSSVMLSSCGFGTRSEVNERREAATSAMKIHAGKWKGYGDMKKTCDECHSTTRKSGSAPALVSLAIHLDRARCQCARPTCHKVSSVPSLSFRVFNIERSRGKKSMYKTLVPTVDSGGYAQLGRE